MSFQQGLSGLNASSKNLSVIGNNIANANTYGTKAARAEFADVYAAALNGAGTNTVGIGTNLATVAQQFTQGSITTTDNPMDLAINGAGFFQVSDERSPVKYTRNGQFKVDKEGYIVDNFQQRLMGYAGDGLGGILNGTLAAIQLPTAPVAPKVTSEITMELNLNSKLAVTLPATGDPIVFNDQKTYNNATSLTVYDDKGQDVALTYYFQKAADNTWNVYAQVAGQTVGGDPPTAIGTIEFKPDGTAPLTVSPSDPIPIVMPVPLTNKAGANITFANNPTLSVGRSTQFGTAFGVTAMTQNGYAAGSLTGVTVDTNGIVVGNYSNGESRPAGQVVIANFRNPQGLQPIGNNDWARTVQSGEPIAGVPGDGNLGLLQAGALEESNVDLTGELVNMITAQRIYQANAQTIKTQDQVLQTLVNLR